MQHPISWQHLMSRRWTILRMELFTKGYLDPLKAYIGVPNRELLVTKESEACSLYNSPDSLNQISLALLAKLKNRSNFGQTIYQDCLKSCRHLVKVSQAVSRGNLKSLSASVLVKRFNAYLVAALDFTPFLALPPNYELYVIDEINQYLVKKVGKNQADEYLQKLMTPREYPFQVLEQIDLAKIALKSTCQTNINQALTAHKLKYQWLSCYNFDEQAFAPKDFAKRLQVFQGLSPTELRDQTDGVVKKLIYDDLEFQRVVAKLGLSNELLNKIKLLREFVFLRTYRIEMNSQSNFYLQPLLNEISNRGQISIRQLAMMLSDEIKALLLTGKVPDSVNFKHRQAHAVFWLDNAEYHHAFGPQAQAFISTQIINSNYGHPTDRLSGTAASIGPTITGRVRLLTKNNLATFKPGEILVTTMTSPEFVPAMHKAAAIVTDEGGVLCHAAIVAREMNIPCIISTKVATKIFKNGDLVKVNTKSGYVKLVPE